MGFSSSKQLLERKEMTPVRGCKGSWAKNLMLENAKKIIICICIKKAHTKPGCATAGDDYGGSVVVMLIFVVLNVLPPPRRNER